MPSARPPDNGVRLLLVEDEPRLARLLVQGLERGGYHVVHASDGATALRVAEDPGAADLLVLDIGIPAPDGLTVLRHLRDVGDHRPILLLTGRGHVADRVAGLRAGADDYLPKPFALDELTARIEALLRWQRREQGASITSGSVLLDPASRRVWRRKSEVELTVREFDLLEFLVRHARQVLTRDQLLHHVWGVDEAGDSNLVAVYVKYLRDKIDRPFGTRSLVTVRGVGYRWDPEDD